MDEKDDFIDLLKTIIDDIVSDINMDDNDNIDSNINLLSKIFDIEADRIRELDKIFNGIISDFTNVGDVIKSIRSIILLSEDEYMYMTFKAGMFLMINFTISNFDALYENMMYGIIENAKKMLNIRV